MQFKYWNYNNYIARIHYLAENPHKIKQGKGGGCVIATMIYFWILTDKKNFIRASIELYKKGRTKVNRFKIRPNRYLYGIDPSNEPDLTHHYYDNFIKPEESIGADWILISSIHDSLDPDVHFYGTMNNLIGHGNNREDVMELMEDFLGFDVHQFTFKGKHKGISLFNGLEKYDKAGWHTALDIDCSFMLKKKVQGPAMHSVAIVPGSVKKEYVPRNRTTSYQITIVSWGKTYRLRLKPTQIQRYILGASMGKAKNGFWA